ncbi:MAG: TolC family protein [Melioribacteraceae bacterium]
MKIRKHIFVIILVLFTSIRIQPQEKLTLSEAIKIGLENNYDIRIAKKDLQIADENNSWGSAGRYPSIDLGVTSVNRFDDTGINEVTTQSLVPSVTLNWTLFNGFKIYNTKKKLNDIFKLTEGSVAVLIENKIQSIILSYYNVLLQKEKLKVFEEVEKLSKDRYDRAQLSKEIGSSVSYEVLQAKNSWLEDRSTYLSQKLILDNSIRSLNLLIGEKNDKVYDFIDDFTAPESQYFLEDLKNKMLTNNRTLKNQYINQLIADRNIDIAQDDYYPTLRLNSGYDYENSNQRINNLPKVNTKSYDYYANVSLGWNLFNGLNTGRAVEIAQIEKEISEIETEQIEHSLTNTLSQLFELFSIRKELLNVAEENLEAAKLNLKISEEKFRNGSITSFNYRDIQIIFLNAAVLKLNAIYNLKETDTELARITGSIISEE